MGRRRSTLTVDDGVTIDMAVCLMKGMFRPGAAWKGTMHWTDSRSGREIAAVSYVVDMRTPEDANLWLSYTVTDRDGERHEQATRIAMVTTQPHFGGHRWWFQCPRSGRRVRCLHLGGGSRTFASRQALGLKYRCQGEGDADRLFRAACVVNERLGGGSLNDEPPKPKWMRWPTYWRLCAKRDEVSLRSLVAGLATLGVR